MKDQYAVANSFLTALCDRFLDGDRSRMVLIPGNHDICWNTSRLAMEQVPDAECPSNLGSPDIKVGPSPGRSDQELYDLGRMRLIHGFFWDLPEQCFLASVDGRLRRPRSGCGACSEAAKSHRKVLNR